MVGSQGERLNAAYLIESPQNSNVSMQIKAFSKKKIAIEVRTARARPVESAERRDSIKLMPITSINTTSWPLNKRSFMPLFIVFQY